MIVAKSGNATARYFWWYAPTVPSTFLLYQYSHITSGTNQEQGCGPQGKKIPCLGQESDSGHQVRMLHGMSVKIMPH